MDIFKEYPDLYEEMIEEKRDTEMLKLFKSMQPKTAGIQCDSCVKMENKSFVIQNCIKTNDAVFKHGIDRFRSQS